MCRGSAGMKKTLKNQQLWHDKLFPVQASLTLSYDIFRTGIVDVIEKMLTFISSFRKKKKKIVK